MSTSALNAYSTAPILTADPITLTSMLFDGALKAMRKARRFHEAGNRQGFIGEIDRAQLIVGELLATLDVSRGEIARNLSSIYAYCMRSLVESTLGDLSKLAEAEKHIGRIAQAWKTAAAQLRSAAAPTGGGLEAAA
jgi:flagellar protein FliS